jgi:hypothetical protein
VPAETTPCERVRPALKGGLPEQIRFTCREGMPLHGEAREPLHTPALDMGTQNLGLSLRVNLSILS